MRYFTIKNVLVVLVLAIVVGGFIAFQLGSQELKNELILYGIVFGPVVLVIMSLVLFPNLGDELKSSLKQGQKRQSRRK